MDFQFVTAVHYPKADFGSRPAMGNLLEDTLVDPMWTEEELAYNAHVFKIRDAARTIKEATSRGLTPIITSGGANPLFSEYAESLGAKVYDEYDSHQARMHGAFQRGYDSGADYVFWCEPDKFDLVKSFRRIVDEGFGADVIIPRRDETSLAYMPPFQRDEELFSNYVLNTELGTTGLDFLFGPKAVEKGSIDNFLGANGTWGIIMEGVWNALAEGKKVTPVEVPFEYLYHYKLLELENPGMKKFRAEQNKSIQRDFVIYMLVNGSLRPDSKLFQCDML
jgi:hypothetical protein